MIASGLVSFGQRRSANARTEGFPPQRKVIFLDLMGFVEIFRPVFRPLFGLGCAFLLGHGLFLNN